MKILSEESCWKVTITWSKPMVYENLLNNGSNHDDEAHLYMITGRYKNHSNKVFYIGKTYKNVVSKRLTQKDHKSRYKQLKEEHPNHEIYVHHGVVTIEDGKRTEKRIDEIESILIYSMPTEHCINEKNYFSHGVTGQYLLFNKGHKSNMPSKVALGVFTN